MKTAILKDDGNNKVTYNTPESGAREYQIQNHRYPLPAERSSKYNKLIKERDARNPESMLEPDQGKLMAADIDYEYNYYVEPYERLSSVYPPMPEANTLPPLNMFLARDAEMFSEYNDIRRGQMRKHDDLYEEIYGIHGRARTTSFNNRMTLSREYFEDFGHGAAAYYRSNPMDKQTVFNFVNNESQKLFLDNENKREHFPFFGKINVEGFANSEVANILEDYRLDREFLNWIADNRDAHETDIRTMRYEVGDLEIPREVRAYPIEYFIEHGTVYNNARNRLLLIEYRQPETAEEIHQNRCAYFEKFLLSNLAKQKIINYYNSAAVGTSTPVAFRVEKYSEDRKDLIEVHYFFNYKDMNNFKLFDTQVFYDTQYHYDIKIINSVVVEDAASGARNMVFLEEFFYSDSFYILDSPPIAPDVELITYRGVSNKLLILFNQMIDQKAMVPIYINESDSESFQKQYLAQKIPRQDPIMFESDDPTNFELFKCLKHPSEYSEFANTYYRVISSGGRTAASYTDTIIPNQTYYYMFRALDMHGFASNPSPIYEFTLIKEGETMYPKIRTVELAKADPPVQKDKTFKKYLKIGYSAEQVQLEPDLLETIGNDMIGHQLSVGTASDKIVGSNRKFKFRIKSKNTGKLIDINVTFKKNKVIKA